MDKWIIRSIRCGVTCIVVAVIFIVFFFVGLEDGPNQMTCPKYITDERGHPLNGGHFRTCCGLFLIEMIIGLFYLRLCIVYLLI